MKRFGPLHHIGRNLVIGDPGRRHLRLTPEALSHRNNTDEQHRFSWDALTSVVLDLPTTPFRLPGMVAGVASAAIMLVTQDTGFDVEDGSVTITTADGSLNLPLSKHHAGKYWQHPVTTTQDLLGRLIADPASRTLLNRPDELLGAVARSARRR